MKTEIPINQKLTLTIKEASEYSNIGVHRLYELTSNPLCPYVIWSGKKRLIKREEFEKFIKNNRMI